MVLVGTPRIEPRRSPASAGFYGAGGGPHLVSDRNGRERDRTSYLSNVNAAL